jgi:branched-chain amino acid transport system substrate-binding protein
VVDTGPTDFAPVEQMQMSRFDGETWQLFGAVISGKVGGT